MRNQPLASSQRSSHDMPSYPVPSKRANLIQRFPTRTVRFGYEHGPDPSLIDTFIHPHTDVFWFISYAFELIDCKEYTLRKTLGIVSEKGLRSKRENHLRSPRSTRC